MKLVKAALVAALAVTTIGTVALPVQAAPLPTNLGAMAAARDTPVVQVRYGRGYGGGGWGHRGWGGGYRGWGGNRGWGYRGYGGWGLGAAAVGGAIVSSGYYGGAYPYYGGGYAEEGADASDYCPPSGYGHYYSGYSPRRYYNGW